MKILIASTSATGHLNPLLAIARILIAEGHEITCLTGTAMRGRVEAAERNSARCPRMRISTRMMSSRGLRALKTIPPGPEWIRVAMERLFVDHIPGNTRACTDALQDFPADVIVGDDMFFGVLPMLLGPRAKRPARRSLRHVVSCTGDARTARRFHGLPPATTEAERNEYAAIAREYDGDRRSAGRRATNRC